MLAEAWVQHDRGTWAVFRSSIWNQNQSLPPQIFLRIAVISRWAQGFVLFVLQVQEIWKKFEPVN